ncbi:gamma-secretase subunit APH-1A isoform X2 [Prinia subflava]|uniref:gamma-secretase subunit APH-1A isoform X2 n=1 Tax=Prinia subflava TaxID=208062 RepID=UPI002FE1C9F8
MVRVAPHAGFRGESEETGKDRSIAELSVLHLPSSKSWRHKVSTENNAWWRGCCCQQLTVSIPPCLERGKKGVFLAAVAAGGLAALVRGGAAQRAGGRGAAAARSRRGRAAAGALQVRLLQNTQEPSPLTPCWPVALPSPGCGTELMLSLWGRRKADEGLATLSEDGQSPMSLRQMAYVSGLSFGIISGIFSISNILADSAGPGTVGIHGDSPYYFITSAFLTMALTFLNPCYEATLGPIFILTLCTGLWAFGTAGGSFRNVLKCLSCKQEPEGQVMLYSALQVPPEE